MLKLSAFRRGFLNGERRPAAKAALLRKLFRGMNAPAPSGFALCANEFDLVGLEKADSLTGMTDRKARARAGGCYGFPPLPQKRRQGWGTQFCG
jgi:hypothetical protein